MLSKWGVRGIATQALENYVTSKPNVMESDYYFYSMFGKVDIYSLLMSVCDGNVTAGRLYEVIPRQLIEVEVFHAVRWLNNGGHSKFCGTEEAMSRLYDYAWHFLTVLERFDLLRQHLEPNIDAPTLEETKWELLGEGLIAADQAAKMDLWEVRGVLTYLYDRYVGLETADVLMAREFYRIFSGVDLAELWMHIFRSSYSPSTYAPDCFVGAVVDAVEIIRGSKGSFANMNCLAVKEDDAVLLFLTNFLRVLVDARYVKVKNDSAGGFEIYFVPDKYKSRGGTWHDGLLISHLI